MTAHEWFRIVNAAGSEQNKEGTGRARSTRMRTRSARGTSIALLAARQRRTYGCCIALRCSSIWR